MNGIYKYRGIDWLLQEDLSKQNYQTLQYKYGDITIGILIDSNQIGVKMNLDKYQEILGTQQTLYSD